MRCGMRKSILFLAFALIATSLGACGSDLSRSDEANTTATATQCVWPQRFSTMKELISYQEEVEVISTYCPIPVNAVTDMRLKNITALKDGYVAFDYVVEDERSEKLYDAYQMDTAFAVSYIIHIAEKPKQMLESFIHSGFMPVTIDKAGVYYFPEQLDGAEGAVFYAYLFIDSCQLIQVNLPAYESAQAMLQYTAVEIMDTFAEETAQAIERFNRSSGE